MAEKDTGKSRKSRPKGTQPAARTRGGFSLKYLVWLLVILIVLGIAFLIAAKPVFNIDLREKFTRSEVTTGTASILSKMEDLFLFQSVEYVYKTVFPYDFVSADYDWRKLLDKELFGDELSKKERENLALYRFCEDIGISLLKRNIQFVVVTTVVRGGFDLEGTPFADPEGYPDPENYIKIDEEAGILYLRLPPPIITDIEIEDMNSATYPYPDIDISPENYKRLVEFISMGIEERVLTEGILELAKQRGTAFIEAILLETGLEEIVFVEGEQHIQSKE